MMVHAPILIIGIPLLGAFATLLISKLGKVRNWFVILILAVTSGLAFALATDVFKEGIRIYVLGGETAGFRLPSGYLFPIRIILQIDGVGAFMGIITAIISLLGGIYSITFMKKHTGLDKYYTLSLLLIAGMYGMAFTGDAFNFFVFLEVTSVAVCGLIGFRSGRAESPEAAFKTMVLYTIAGLLVLLGVGILYGQYGALNFAYLASLIQNTHLDKIALVLFIVALGMKAGAVPMHMWVADAYPQAPTPATVILVVNSLISLYALYRFCFTLYGVKLNSLAVGWTIIILGILSMLIGVTMSLIQKDIKRLIAYSGVCQVGYMMLGVGVGLAVLGTPAMGEYGLMAIKGGIFHLINYALYEGLLFLAAGAISYRIGTRSLDAMGGLGHSMRWTATFFLIGGAAIAGLPPLNGFASKLIIYQTVFRFSPILSVIALIISILTLAIFTRAFQSAFLGERTTEVKEVPAAMKWTMAVLAIAVIVFGIFPNLVLEYIVTPAALALVEQSQYIEAILGVVTGR
jgi:multicomponent Na+:H+ antiporter subunit D